MSYMINKYRDQLPEILKIQQRQVKEYSEEFCRDTSGEWLASNGGSGESLGRTIKSVIEFQKALYEIESKIEDLSLTLVSPNGTKEIPLDQAPPLVTKILDLLTEELNKYLPGME